MESLAARLARYERRRKEKVKAREERKAEAERKAKRLEEKLALGPPAPRKVKPKEPRKPPLKEPWASAYAMMGLPYRTAWSDEPIRAWDSLALIGPETKALDARSLVAFALAASGLDRQAVAAAVGVTHRPVATVARLVSRGYELSRNRPVVDEVPEPPAE
jgi:hypothetical protein